MNALNSLLRQRSYLALSLATLALAVGANLVVFSVVNALWLRPRPVKDPDRIVMVMGDTSSISDANASARGSSPGSVSSRSFWESAACSG